MSWWHNLFPTQTRESEIEHTVHNCVNHIINSGNEYTPYEQMRIVHRVRETVEKALQEEHIALLEEIKEYEQILGFDK